MITSKKMKALSHAVMIFLTICALAPFLLMIASSFTDDATLKKFGYSFWPKEFSFSAYQYLLSDGTTILRAYGITIFVTVVGTILALVMTTMLAYALSVEKLPGRKFFSFFVLFAMLFSGGTVPTYIMWTQTFHIRNTIWALIVPNYLVFAFYVILARSYFENNIPKEVLESARIDGANEFTIMLKIVMPMAVPIVATIGMMVAITYWNDWTNGLYYVNDESLYKYGLKKNKKDIVGVHITRKEEAVEVLIYDSGPGFPEEILEKLNRGEKLETEKVRSGIGIYNIIKRLEIACHNRAEVVLCNDNGACVKIMIPLR